MSKSESFTTRERLGAWYLCFVECLCKIPRGLPRVIQLILQDVRGAIRSQKIRCTGIQQAKRVKAKGGSIKLDLGCGPIKRPGFVGVDLSSRADIQWDVRWGLPFDDNSIAEIRSDHLFEHLELPQVVELLRECGRVLIEGGTLDFTVPHFDPYLAAYLHRDFDFLREKIYDVPQGQEELYDTCFDRISWLLHRNGEHKSLFDKESMVAKVKLAGFSGVQTREFDAARDMDQRLSSVYVVAIR